MSPTAQPTRVNPRAPQAVPAPEGKKRGRPKSDKPKVEKTAYLQSPDAEQFRGPEGKLIAIPTTINRALYFPPTGDDFAQEDVYLEWRANDMEERGNALIERAGRLRRNAESARKYGGDPAKRKTVLKFQRMKDQLATLMAQLREEGIELDEELEA